MENEKFNDQLEIGGDLQDEYKAIQHAELAEEFDGQAVSELLIEMWEEDRQREEYTEKDAFRDFISDQHDEFN